MRERAKGQGATLKQAKMKICKPEVKWIGRIFSVAGVSADPDEIQHIVQAGRHETIEDVRSLLQAARVRLWFPGTDRVVERKARTCKTCQASIDRPRPRPTVATPRT